MLNILIGFVLGAVLLGLVLRAQTALTDWWGRRQRRIGRRVQIVVLVDQGRKSKCRTCFWKRALRTKEHDLRFRTKVRYISLADQLRRQRNPSHDLFSIETTDVIIVNWDAMNGDPVYGSDRTYAFVTHYRPDMREWLSNGGVLIVESQGASWAAAQAPYDCFSSLFPDSHVTVSSGMWTLGNCAAVSGAAVSDVVARDLDNNMLALKPSGLWERRAWFPRRRARVTRRPLDGSTQSLGYIKRHQAHLYRGWFAGWSDDWIHVLSARDGAIDAARSGDDGKAVLVYRRVAAAAPQGTNPTGGAVVLTTMFIASSELYQLIANLLKLSDHPIEHVIDESHLP